MKQDGEHDRAFERPDRVLEPPHARDGQIGLYHRNDRSMLPELLSHQKLEDLLGQVDDPLINRTSGCVVQAHGAEAQTAGDLAEQTIEVQTQGGQARLSVVSHVAQTSTLGQWSEALQAHAAEARSLELDAARAAHEQWWHQFWRRSFIDITGDAAAERVTQAYAAQRFISACAGRGRFPIKFNGSIFTMRGPATKAKRRNADGETVTDPEQRYNPDYRRWGGGYWFQNTRLIYWPMLAAGDWEMIEPWFQQFEDVLRLCRHRVQKHLGIEGAFFPETMTMWGTYRNDNYGYDRAPERSGALTENHYIRWYWQCALELATMMLEYRAQTGRDAWWRQRAYPLVLDALKFYYGYFTDRDAQGRIRFEPMQVLETYWDAANPSPDIAGLQHVLDALLALPAPLTPDADRPFLQRFRDELPPIPVGTDEEGLGPQILPGERYADKHNMENCALYAVFPYPQGALGGPLHEEAQCAFDRRPMQKVGGWFQDAVQAALLGRADEAADLVTAALAPDEASEAQLAQRGFEITPGLRFPGFFGPNADWVPDQDHGCVNSLALQRMLLQTQNGALRVLPAWPERWNVHFRLHAPGGTVVEAQYEDGRITQQQITPARRQRDVAAAVEPVASG